MILKLLFSPFAQEQNMSSAHHVDDYIRYPAPPRQIRLNLKAVVLGRFRGRNFSAVCNRKKLQYRIKSTIVWRECIINCKLLVVFVEFISSQIGFSGEYNNEVRVRKSEGVFSILGEQCAGVFPVLARLLTCDRAFSPRPRFRFGSFSSSMRQGGLSSRTALCRS